MPIEENLLPRFTIPNNRSETALPASNAQGILFVMQVSVLYFGVLRDIFQREKELIALPSGATVGTLLDHYRELAPDRQGLWSAIAVAVNQEYARKDRLISEGDEIAMLPPVSGGSTPDAPRRVGAAADRHCQAGGVCQAG